MDTRKSTVGMIILERIPALGAAESLAKYHSLANLFEPGELFAIWIWSWRKEPPWGRDRAEVVLGPFAETKGPRRAGAKPRLKISKRDTCLKAQVR